MFNYNRKTKIYEFDQKLTKNYEKVIILPRVLDHVIINENTEYRWQNDLNIDPTIEPKRFRNYPKKPEDHRKSPIEGISDTK